MSACLSLKQLDLVFGSHPKKAFEAINIGLCRDEVQKEFKQTVVLQNVQLEVYTGEILVLMGLSGSGKSSLLRCLNGMNGRGFGHVRGSVLFEDPSSKQFIDIMKCPSSKLREIRRNSMAMVFQQFGLMPWRTVLENVAYPLELQNISKEERLQRSQEKLTLVGLSNWAGHFPSELSGGMQQRVGLARAFVTDADLLLMDEPFSALDPLHRRSLQDEILRLQEKLKKTIVFVTHDPSEAARLGDRVAVLDSGKVLQIDTPEKLLNNPSSERVHRLLTVQ